MISGAVPFDKLLPPPDGLAHPDRFQDWIRNASLGHSPLPSEDLVVTSDGFSVHLMAPRVGGSLCRSGVLMKPMCQASCLDVPLGLWMS